MKPLEEFIDDELTVPENTDKINEFVGTQSLQGGDLLRAAVQYSTDAITYVMALTIDLADAVGALPDGHEATMAGGEAALRFYQAAALYNEVRDRQLREAEVGDEDE